MDQMIEEPYIKVAVCLPVMHWYTYAVPDHLRAACCPGMRVLVPFGKRRVTGYIVSGQKHCGKFAVKNILDILDDYPMFPESEIPFFQWIADYYIHPPGDVIKAALPAGLDTHDVSCVFVTESGRKKIQDQGLGPGEAQVIELAAEREPCSLKYLRQKSGIPGINALVRKMESKGLIRISSVMKKGGPVVKKEKFILPGTGNETGLRMSKKRTKLLSIVQEKKEISLTALKTYLPTAPALVKPLEKAGLVKIVLRRVFRDPFGDPVEPDIAPELTQEQKEAVAQVQNEAGRGFVPFLLFGVTGSGKTEVYMRLVKDAVDSGKTALVLVPEISLISQTERRFRARFGNRVAVIHSGLTKGQLYDQWRQIALGRAAIVIGARSALFAPLDKIGIIIVDEEHDASYKQETGLRYNARDLAVVRAKMNHCPVVLGSATPSVQSYYNAVSGRFRLLKLEKRVNKYPLPEIDIVDLKKYRDERPDAKIITPELYRAVRACLDRGKQALIFLNRRGFASSAVCVSCGSMLLCEYCDVTMTFHRSDNEFRCHLCGFKRSAPVTCPSCKKGKTKPFGFGTEKVEKIMKSLFPDARVARMDQDTTSRKGAMLGLLKNIRNHNVDIIVGTQMLAKGHDFPGIILVGIVCADLSLSLPDFRAGERTFQVLAQVAGRAGRADMPGKVIMQTYNPDHFIIEMAGKQDFPGFFHKELPFRKALKYPPFSRMIQLKISGTDPDRVKEYALRLAGILNSMVKADKKFLGKMDIMGPVEASIQRISARFRWLILLKSPFSSLLNVLVKSMMDDPGSTPLAGVSMTADVDPYSLM